MKKLRISSLENLEGRAFKETYNNLAPHQSAIVEQVERLCKTLENSINSLNGGGCGVFAYYMSTKLKELGLAHKILVSDGGVNGDWETLNNNFKNGDQEWLSASHVFIELFGLMFDGYGWLCENEEGVIARIYPKEEIAEWDHRTMYQIVGEFDYILLRKATIDNKSGYGWNWCYDSRQNPLVKEIINSTFIK